MVVDYDLLAELAKEYEYQYDVEDLYGKMIASKLSEEFGIYVGFRDRYFICDSVGFKVYFRDVKDYKQLYSMIKDKIGDGADDAKLKDKFHYLFGELSVESKIGEFHDYSRGSFDSMQFFDLLWYLKDHNLNIYEVENQPISKIIMQKPIETIKIDAQMDDLLRLIKITSEQYKLYKLIYERFLASQMADATYNSMTVDIECAGHKFETTGKRSGRNFA